MILKMWEKFFPKFRVISGQVNEGNLQEGVINFGNEESYIVSKGIPRLVESDGYASNFGLQWSLFKLTQLDSNVGLPVFEERFYKNTKWSKEELRDKWVLEAGSGSGCFTEIFKDTHCHLFTFDLSRAVDANSSIHGNYENIQIFQASIYELPFPKQKFDYVFCYGVLQHTPDPELALKALYEQVQPGGKMSIDWYIKEWKPTPWSYPKYLWRPITKRLNPALLLKIVKFYIPLYLPFDTLLKKIPKIGELISAFIPIPCFNYHALPLSPKHHQEWAILATFDALGAAYDFPKNVNEVTSMCERLGVENLEVFKGSNGVVANFSRPQN